MELPLLLLFDGESDICCLNGKIKLRPINPPTDEVKNIYSGESATSKEFLKHIRGYNSRFAFTSLGTKNAEIPGRGPPTFKISGRMHYYIGQLLPPENTEAVFAQVYINDEEEQERIRLKGEFNPNSIRLWNRVMNSINPFAIRFRQIGMEGCPDKSYVLKKKHSNKLVLAATVVDPKSGRKLEVLTNNLGVHLFSANFFKGTDVGKMGKAFHFRESFALETQDYNSLNQKSFPTLLLKPGEKYETYTVYHFSSIK